MSETELLNKIVDLNKKGLLTWEEKKCQYSDYYESLYKNIRIIFFKNMGIEVMTMKFFTPKFATLSVIPEIGIGVSIENKITTELFNEVQTTFKKIAHEKYITNNEFGKAMIKEAFGI